MQGYHSSKLKEENQHLKETLKTIMAYIKKERSSSGTAPAPAANPAQPAPSTSLSSLWQDLQRILLKLASPSDAPAMAKLRQVQAAGLAQPQVLLAAVVEQLQLQRVINKKLVSAVEKIKKREAEHQEQLAAAGEQSAELRRKYDKAKVGGWLGVCGGGAAARVCWSVVHGLVLPVTHADACGTAGVRSCDHTLLSVQSRWQHC
jgi:hypothetical protein